MLKKKRFWMFLLASFAWLVALGGVVVLMSFIGAKKGSVLCKDVKVYIPGNQYFIDKEEIDNILQVKSRALIGRPVDGINIQDLESKLKANPFIASAKVYTDMDGIIKVEISQRQPILRMINLLDKDFYVDQNGLKIPLSDNFTARVIVANGFIEEPFAGQIDTLHNPVSVSIFKIADFIRRDSLWDAQIAQIYVNANREIELIPRVGNQHILIGNADSLATKFRNLEAFYKQALPKVGWDAYKTINIKYANQVIGVRNILTKKDSLMVKAKADSAKMKKDTSLTKI